MTATALLNALAAGCTIFLFSCSFFVISRLARRFDFAVGSYGTLAAYVAVSVLEVGVGLGFLMAAFLVAMVTTSLQYLLYAQLPSRAAALVASVGVGTVIVHTLALIYGPDRVSSFSGHQVGSALLTDGQIVAVTGATTVFVISFIIRIAGYGLWFRATAESPELAAAYGANVSWVSAASIAAAGVLAAAGGLAQAMDLGITPTGNARVTLFGVAAAAAGGVNLYGVLAASLLIGAVQNVATLWLPVLWADSAALLSCIAIFTLGTNRERWRDSRTVGI